MKKESDMNENKWKISFYEMELNFAAMRRLAQDYQDALLRIARYQPGGVVLPQDATIEAVPKEEVVNMQKIAADVLEWKMRETTPSQRVNVVTENQ